MSQPHAPGHDPVGYWFDTRPLTEKPAKVSDAPDSATGRLRAAWKEGDSLADRVASLRSANLKGVLNEQLTDAFRGGMKAKRFAAANGLSYVHQAFDATGEDRLQGMIFRNGERRYVVSWGDPVAVEFGNWSTLGQELVLSFGYIAVRHDLGLPHLICDARANDAEPPRGSRVYARQSSYTSLSENYRGSDSASPLGRIASQIEPVDLGADVDRYFQAYCDRGQTQAARELVTGDTLRLLCAMSLEFDIEITHDWIYLYANAVHVSWVDPDRWAWVFSIASRLWDHVETLRLAAGESPAAERPPFHTEQLIPRPADLAKLPKPSPGWQVFWKLGDPHQ